MNSSDARIGLIEDSLKRAWRAIQNLLDRMARQESRLASIPGGGYGGGGGSNLLYQCQPSSTVAAASGSWPSITGTSFTADIYGWSSGSFGLIASAQTVTNNLPSSLAASKVCWVLKDATGGYFVITQSCT